MKRLLALVLAFASMISAADAHHKPGHNPPGHLKHGKKVVIHRSVVPEREISRWAWADEIVIGIAGDDSVDGEETALVSELNDMDWRIYRDTVFNFGIELPFAVFEPGLEGGRGLRLDQIGGGKPILMCMEPRTLRGCLQKSSLPCSIRAISSGRSPTGREARIGLSSRDTTPQVPPRTNR